MPGSICQVAAAVVSDKVTMRWAGDARPLRPHQHLESRSASTLVGTNDQVWERRYFTSLSAGHCRQCWQPCPNTPPVFPRHCLCSARVSPAQPTLPHVGELLHVRGGPGWVAIAGCTRRLARTLSAHASRAAAGMRQRAHDARHGCDGAPAKGLRTER
jgi:hypothetical protein